jgi:hypothetical protein
MGGYVGDEAPRITVPLDVEAGDVAVPSWIDLNVDYWTLWRHHYDKWNIQAKFARIKQSMVKEDSGINIATTEISRLLCLREKLLMEHPDRQDIDVRSRRATKQVWRYLQKAQIDGTVCAAFDCAKVEKDFGWSVGDDGEDMWDQIGTFLMEQGVEGRIFIDPRGFYNHFSWCVEDSAKPVSPETLDAFYAKFARLGDTEPRGGILECGECVGSIEACLCSETCLLCLPQVDGCPPISPLSSLPSPPRTPGTQTPESYFKGKRLRHPVPHVDIQYTDEEAVNILMAFAGAPISSAESSRRPPRGRSRHRGNGR